MTKLFRVIVGVFLVGLVTATGFATNPVSRYKKGVYHFNATRTLASGGTDYIGKLAGDKIWAYPSQCSDTTGLGTACTYLGGSRYLWSFQAPSADVWKFYEVHGLDSLITGMDSILVVPPTAPDSVVTDYVAPKSQRGVTFALRSNPSGAYAAPGPINVATVLFPLGADSIDIYHTQIVGFHAASDSTVIKSPNGVNQIHLTNTLTKFGSAGLKGKLWLSDGGGGSVSLAIKNGLGGTVVWYLPSAADWDTTLTWTDTATPYRKAFYNHTALSAGGQVRVTQEKTSFSQPRILIWSEAYTKTDSCIVFCSDTLTAMPIRVHVQYAP